MPRDPYKKLLDSPLKPPDTSIPLASKSIPENILWLQDGRGFVKRPGSTPFASAPVPSVDNVPYMGQLLSILTPQGLLIDDNPTNERNKETQTLIGYRYGQVVFGDWSSSTPDYTNYGLFELKNYKAFVLSNAETAVGGTQSFTRSFLGRTDSQYYYGNGNARTAISDVDQVGSLTPLVAPSATFYNTKLQGQQPALRLSAEPINTNKKFTADKRFDVAIGEMTPGGSGYAPLKNFSLGKIDAAQTESGSFIGGAGGPVFYYDGFRSYVMGAYDLNGLYYSTNNGGGTPFFEYQQVVPFAQAGAAGVLTGAYGYFITHCVKLRSGEIVEGNGIATPSVSVSAQQIQFGYPSTYLGLSGLLGSSVKEAYNMKTYSTSTSSGSTTTLVINESHDIKAGDVLLLMKNGSKVDTANLTDGLSAGEVRVTAVSGQTITLSEAVSVSGTTYITYNSYFQVYRTVAGGSIYKQRAVFSYTELAATNVGAVLFNDNAADNTLGADYIATPYTRAASPSVTHAVTSHQGRLVALSTAFNPYATRYGGPSFSTDTYEGSNVPFVDTAPVTLYWSPSSSMHYLPPENSLTVPGSGTPMALVSIDDVLYIFMSDAIYYVQGTLGNVGEFTLHLLTREIGCRDARSVARVNNVIYFMSQDGLTALSGTSIDTSIGKPVRKLLQEPDRTTATYVWTSKNLLLVSANRSIDVQRQTTEQRYQTATNSAGLAPPYRYLATFTDPCTLVMDMTTGNWARWSIDCYNGAVEFKGDLIIAPSNDTAQIYTSASLFKRLSDANNWTDSGEAFTARYFTEWFDNGAPMLDKQYNRLSIFATDSNSSGNSGFPLSVKTEVDWIPGRVLDSFDEEDLNTDGYASTPYASAPYGDLRRSYKTLPLTDENVKSLRVVIEDSSPNNDICITAMAVEVTDTFDNATDT